jgi:hypothetical protein
VDLFTAKQTKTRTKLIIFSCMFIFTLTKILYSYGVQSRLIHLYYFSPHLKYTIHLEAILLCFKFYSMKIRSLQRHSYKDLKRNYYM